MLALIGVMDIAAGVRSNGTLQLGGPVTSMQGRLTPQSSDSTDLSSGPSHDSRCHLHPAALWTAVACLLLPFCPRDVGKSQLPTASLFCAVQQRRDLRTCLAL